MTDFSKFIREVPDFRSRESFSKILPRCSKIHMPSAMQWNAMAAHYYDRRKC